MGTQGQNTVVCVSGAHSHRCGELQGSLEQVEGWRCLDKGPTGLCGEPPSFPEVVAGPCTPPPPSSQGPCMGPLAIELWASSLLSLRAVGPDQLPSLKVPATRTHIIVPFLPHPCAQQLSPGEGVRVSWHTLGREEQGENQAAGQMPGQLGCEAPCPTSAEQVCRTSTPGQLTCMPWAATLDGGLG